MKYLITGGAGFIGSHLSEALLDRGDFVDAVDNFSTGDESNIIHLKYNPKFSFYRNSIETRHSLSSLVNCCDVIIHLAAAVGVKQIINDPVKTIETNIMGTELVLKEAIRKGKKVFIASTSEVYGRGIQCPFNEEQDLLLGPTTKSRWSYAASKIVDEFLALAYYKKYNLPIVIGRFFNIVGERQVGRYGMVVPSFIKQAVNGNDIIVYGDGTQTRCFCYVKNAVQDILKLLDNEKCIGQVFNIGNDDEISITYLASEVKRLINSNSEIKYLPYDQAYEEGFEDMKRRVPDLNKIKKYIDWSERDSLPLIIEKCKIRMETGYA